MSKPRSVSGSLIPAAWVLAQSILQLTPAGHSLKNIMTAPRSRVVLRLHPAVSGTSASHGAEYARVQPRPASRQNVCTTSILRTYSFVRNWLAHMVTALPGGSDPLTWQ